MKKVRFVNLEFDKNQLRKNIIKRFEKILKHGQFILGPEVHELEKKISKYCGRKYCLGTASGTDAIYLAVKALNLSKGDEIITSPMTWVSSTNSIVLNNAKPVFVDVKDDLNIDENKIEASITKKTKAILYVNYTGKIANVEKILSIAKKYNLKVIEDAAQSFGSMRNGKRSGSFADISCFSFNPMKILPSLGEAGAIVTDNKKIFEKIKILRYAGTLNKEDCHYPSLNFKIDTIQASFILEFLNNLNLSIKRRKEIANLYNKSLSTSIQTPKEQKNCSDTFYTYTVLVKNRNKLLKHLNDKGIEARVKHPLLVSDQRAYKKFKNKNLVNSKKLIKKIISLPINDKISNSDVNYVIKT
ncbi:DegT/DnrJ/EryC1/StrS family aminotransferase, partial [Candidatus Pelagibacter sp.]|nr:DegT/DnrJ/EryC1/StrS family aminotransferase [Candidatus Pelagibacter sp.]